MIRVEGSHTNGKEPGRRLLATKFELHRDAFGRLHYADESGQTAVGASVTRCFPYSDPERWIAISDAKGNELACLESLDEAPEAARRLLEEELAQREFTPVIRRVYSTSGVTEPCEWDVETDRGRTKLVLKSEDDIRRIAAHGALIRDAVGIRYLIPDSRLLDSSSRQIVERYL